MRSPLYEAGLFKDEIRELSRLAGLSTWDEPASPCLSSRIPYGEKVTMDKLRMIEEGEKALKKMGARHVRLRHHGTDLARLEVGPDEMKRFADPEFRKAVSDRLKKIGYAYVSLDLEGYRSGSLNEALGMRPGC